MRHPALRLAAGQAASTDLFGGGLAGKASFMRNISLLFGENNYKSLSQRKCLKNKILPDTGSINRKTKLLWRLC